MTLGWIAAALLVHWIVRRVPTHLAQTVRSEPVLVCASS